MAAEKGHRVSLALHGDAGRDASKSALRILRSLGADLHVVRPDDIESTLLTVAEAAETAGEVPHTIPGGCHTKAAAVAYRDAAQRVLAQTTPDAVIVASGTGAIQGGIIAAAARTAPATRVIGVSIARDKDRGIGPVREAAAWAGEQNANVEFREEFRDGGYAEWSKQTADAVSFGWRYGFPLEHTYTGKAFAALMELARCELQRARILFWHTGGYSGVA